MEEILTKLSTQIPDISFKPSSTFCWSPKTRTILFDKSKFSDEVSIWSLLHETGHAILNHTEYNSDIGLLLLETEAWSQAKDLAVIFGIVIDEDHIQDCLDTYRDWLHQRSTCPKCGIASLQELPQNYRCYNCNSTWSVSLSRFCRPYRRSKTGVLKKSLLEKTHTTTFR